MKKKKNIKKQIEGVSDFESLMKIISEDISNSDETEDADENDRIDVNCRICGFEYSEEDPPWQKVEGEWYSNNEICLCCNVQFGYEDTTIGSVRRYREKWISQGADFYYKNLKPRDWSAESQLQNLNPEWI